MDLKSIGLGFSPFFEIEHGIGFSRIIMGYYF